MYVNVLGSISAAVLRKEKGQDREKDRDRDKDRDGDKDMDGAKTWIGSRIETKRGTVTEN